MTTQTSTSKDFLIALRNRRSIYGISSEPVISDERIQEVIQEAVKHTPSAFNSQSSRVILLLNEQHHKLWDITKEALRKVVYNEEQFKQTEQKLAGFRGGYGTALFFEDNKVVEGLQAQFPSYADNFPKWSHHASGMLQLAVWVALEAEGFGATLQHYNPLIDQEVKKQWNVPDSWNMIAQMPFGKPTMQPGEKTFQPVEDRVKVFK